MKNKLNSKTITEIISKSKKSTPAKVYVTGDFKRNDFEEYDFQAFGEGNFWILIGDYQIIESWIAAQKKQIKDFHVELTARYSALPLIDLSKIEARIEPGAVIRVGANIGKDCIIMMGAVINIGAEIGAETMIDMNAVVGARAFIGKNCHIGAGAVIAGVLEPPSKKPVTIEDNVLVGANAVVLEGVTVGKRSVIAAGAVVLNIIPPGVIAAGIPAQVIRKVEEVSSKEKIAIVKSLRRRK